MTGPKHPVTSRRGGMSNTCCRYDGKQNIWQMFFEKHRTQD